MPFDGLKATPITSKMRQLFGPKGENWIKGDYSKQQSYCLVGAFEVATKQKRASDATRMKNRSMLESAVNNTLKRKLGLRDIEKWNDAQRRTWKDIERVLDMLEELEVLG